MSQKVRGQLSIDTMADDIAGLLDSLGIAGKVALAGVALGGAIGASYRGPASLCAPGAVAVSSPCRPAVAPERRPAGARTAAQDRSRRHGLSPSPTRCRTATRRSCAATPRRFERYRARWLGNDPASYTTVWRMLAGLDMQDELASLRCPVLVIGGSLDRVRPAALAETYRQGNPRCALRRNRLRSLYVGADARTVCRLHRRIPWKRRRLTSPSLAEFSSMTSQPAQQIPGVYHRKIGDIVVTTISDGYLDGNLEVMRNVDVEKARQILQDAFRPARRTSVNTFLIHANGRIAIVDTGSGNYLQPTAGHVQRNLARPASIRSRSIRCC
jgi:hypothetical protein